MSKVRTTLTIDEDVLRAVKVRAARSGRGDSEVIEESLRRDLGLTLPEGPRGTTEPMPEDEAMALALEAQGAARRKRRRRRPPCVRSPHWSSHRA